MEKSRRNEDKRREKSREKVKVIGNVRKKKRRK